MVDVSSIEALQRVVQPHLRLAAERAANLELLHLLSASPDSFSGSSSDADGEDSDALEEEVERGDSGRVSQYPKQHLAAIKEFSSRKQQRGAAAPLLPTRLPSKQKAPKNARVVFSQNALVSFGDGKALDSGRWVGVCWGMTDDPGWQGRCCRPPRPPPPPPPHP